jgi:hypothetical protein
MERGRERRADNMNRMMEWRMVYGQTKKEETRERKEIGVNG